MSDRQLVIDNPIEMVGVFSLLAAFSMVALFATVMFAHAGIAFGTFFSGLFLAVFAYLWGRSFFNLVHAVNEAKERP